MKVFNKIVDLMLKRCDPSHLPHRARTTELRFWEAYTEMESDMLRTCRGHQSQLEVRLLTARTRSRRTLVRRPPLPPLTSPLRPLHPLRSLLIVAMEAHRSPSSRTRRPDSGRRDLRRRALVTSDNPSHSRPKLELERLHGHNWAPTLYWNNIRLI